MGIKDYLSKKTNNIKRDVLKDFDHEKLPSILVSTKEYDSPERDNCMRWLLSHGWNIVEENWMLAGSQEITVLKLVDGNDEIFLHFETNMGVRMHAKKELHERFKDIAITET